MTTRTTKRITLPIDFKAVPEVLDPWFSLNINKKSWASYMETVMEDDIAVEKVADGLYQVKLFGSEVSFNVNHRVVLRKTAQEDGSFVSKPSPLLEFIGMSALHDGKSYSFMRANCKFSRCKSPYGMSAWVQDLLQRKGIASIEAARIATLTNGHLGNALGKAGIDL